MGLHKKQPYRVALLQVIIVIRSDIIHYYSGLLLKYNSSGHISIPPAHSRDIGLTFTDLNTNSDLSGVKKLSFNMA